MDVVKYEVFLKIVERGGFSQTAEDLGYTRSALSKMIGSMEAEIGFPLVKRTHSGIILNEEGKLVLPLIRNLVRDHHLLEETYGAIAGVLRGKIRIGCFPTLAYLLVPDILKGFKGKYPYVQIEVIEENSLPQLENWLKQGVIDIAFISREKHHVYDWFEIMEDPYVALLPTGHVLTEYETVPTEKLHEHKMIVFKTHEGYDQDMLKFKKLTIDGEETYGTNSITFMVRMVAENDCVGIMPLSVAKDAAERYPVVYRNVNEEVIRHIGFAVRENEIVSLALKRFLQYLKTNFSVNREL